EPERDEKAEAPAEQEESGGDSWGHFPEPQARGKSRAPRGAVRKSYRAAVLGTRSLLAATSLHDTLELKHAKRVVQPLVDGAFGKEAVVGGLTTLGHHDEYTYAHAVNATMVAVTMAHFLGLDRRALADIGVAALFHDVGKSAVAHLITRPFDEFTEEERAAAERHPIEGAKLIARSTALNQTTLRCMRVALEHHVHPGGTGFPPVRAGGKDRPRAGHGGGRRLLRIAPALRQPPRRERHALSGAGHDARAAAPQLRSGDAVGAGAVGGALPAGLDGGAFQR